LPIDKDCWIDLRLVKTKGVLCKREKLICITHRREALICIMQRREKLICITQTRGIDLHHAKTRGIASLRGILILDGRCKMCDPTIN